MREKGIGKVKPKTKMLLWTVSAGRCCICNKAVWKDWFTQARGNFGEVAHIIGNRLDIQGREKEKLSQEYVNDIDNLMLLCLEHHQLIDYVEPQKYPDERLRQIKNLHETRIQRVTEDGTKRSIFLKYGANIDAHHAIISNADARLAMILNGWYPTDENPVKLGVDNSVDRDNTKEFWPHQVRELETQFSTKILPYIKPDEETHFSIFALAPIPLLVKLGALFSDKLRAEVYQFHREPEQTWLWEENSKEVDFIVNEPDSFQRTVALNISFSDTIAKERIEQVLGETGVSIWTLTIPKPDKDFLKSRDQLSQFREIFRDILGKIKTHHPDATAIHIFPAMGVAPAVEVGRVWQPKADLPLIIYDENRLLGGFVPALKINNRERNNDGIRRISSRFK